MNLMLNFVTAETKDNAFWTCLKNYWRVRRVIEKNDKTSCVVNKRKRFSFTTYLELFKKYRSDFYPDDFALYWAMGETVGTTRKYGYVHTSDYIKSVELGIRPRPDWFDGTFPNANMFPKYINVSDRCNSRSDDLISVEFKFFIPPGSPEYDFDEPHSFKYNRFCDIIDWCIENCDGEWAIDNFAYDLEAWFTNEEDAVLFKLQWAPDNEYQ